MQTKPLVSCHGDQVLFSSLHSSILQGLPRESVEWRRSYGRATKTVKLEGSFVPYDEDILPNEGDRNLINRPFFHIYWTDCDVETYKTSVKEEIQEWQTAMKQRSIPDWMIVVVLSDEPKLKTKILPRTSVVDKIRSDFCSKQNDRCVVLFNPSKSDLKSFESWNNLYTKLRTHLLASFNRNLGRYEENMRAFRERRNEPGWHFIEYFLVQEELAFIYEMMGVYDEALLQYDELDALFTQFILNQATGSTAPWLSKFLKHHEKWSGLSLARAIDLDTRDLIKLNRVLLLDFRNYLFSRQCAVLFLLGRPGEVAQRAREYLHNAVHEMRLMKIDSAAGMEACWVFVSCLEVLQTCGQHSDAGQMDTYSMYTTSLWDCVRLKLKEVGELFELMPLRSRGEGEEEQKAELDVVRRITQYEPEEVLSDVIRPVEKLRQAVSSREAFKKHYLELSELAMGTFKHIGRLRSARLAGLDLADFYMLLGEASKAEVFLIDALKAYKQEGWIKLTECTTLKLAECQQAIGNKQKYLETICKVCTAEFISKDVQLDHLGRLVDLCCSHEDAPHPLLPLAAIITIHDVSVTSSATINSSATIGVRLTSRLSASIHVDRISLALHKQPGDFRPNQSHDPAVKTPPAKSPAKRTHTRNLSGPVMTFNPIHTQLPNEIPLTTTSDKKERSGNAIGLFCPDANNLLKRSDSGPAGESEKLSLVKDNYGVFLEATSVTLDPGVNELSLINQISQSGYYKVGQLCLEIGHVGFVQNQVTLCPTYLEVVHEETRIEVKCKHTESFVAGMSQDGLIHIHSGSFPVPDVSTLDIVPTTGVVLSGVKGSQIDRIEEMCEGVIEVMVMCGLCHEDRVYDATFVPSWLPDTTLTCPIKVMSPISIRHRLHTSRRKKLIQVIVEGRSDVTMTLSSASLSCSQGLDLEPLTRHSDSTSVHGAQSAYYVWEILPNHERVPTLDLLFSFHYTMGSQSNASGIHEYAFIVQNFQTLYNLRTSISNSESDESEKVVKVGSPCSLEIKVQRVAEYAVTSNEVFLLYEVKSDNKSWTILGKTKAVFSLEDGSYSTNLPAVPLRPGTILHPSVTISKYQSYDCDGDDNNDDRRNSAFFTSDEIYVESLREHVTIEPCNGNMSCDVTLIAPCN